MRYLAIFCLCMTCGFVMGRWTPTYELRQAREEIKDLKKGGNRGNRSRDTAAGAARTFLRIDPAEAAAAAKKERVPEPPAEATAPEEGVETNAVPEEVANTETNRRPRDGRRWARGPRDGEDFEAELEKAKELWKVRSELARNSFLENVQASDEAARQFDVLVEAMNIRLEHTIDTWVERIKNAEDVRPEDGARLMHDLTGAIVLTYDEMDRNMPEGWREESGSEFQLFDFINPRVADSLTEVEGRLERLGPRP